MDKGGGREEDKCGGKSKLRNETDMTTDRMVSRGNYTISYH